MKLRTLVFTGYVSKIVTNRIILVDLHLRGRLVVVAECLEQKSQLRLMVVWSPKHRLVRQSLLGIVLAGENNGL